MGLGRSNGRELVGILQGYEVPFRFADAPPTGLIRNLLPFLSVLR